MSLNKLIEFRRLVHANPELSNQEFETGHRVLEFLKNCKPDEIIYPIGETGLLAEFKGGDDGPSVLLRAELDALPIEEINGFDHRSKTKDVSHMCGHDGHMTILLGVAEYLTKHPLDKGKVSLLFQPGEENGTGAKAVLSDDNHNIGPFDYVLALHNLPSYPLNQLVVKENSFTSHVISLVVKLHGKTAHAAEPELGINPASALPGILELCNRFTINNIDREDFFLVTPIHINVGEKAYGISAGYGEVHLTIRAWDSRHLKETSQQLLEGIEVIANNHSLNVEHEWIFEFFANQNNSDVVDTLRKVARLKGIDLTERKYPFKWGEDFGLFTQKYKGAMFGIGAGEDQPALHNPDYDFPDEIMGTAIDVFTGFINEVMS